MSSSSSKSRSPLTQIKVASNPSNGIPYILKALNSYLEPHSYRIRHVSATEIVGFLGRHLDSSQNPGLAKTVLSLKLESHNNSDIFNGSKRAVLTKRHNIHYSFSRDKTDTINETSINGDAIKDIIKHSNESFAKINASISRSRQAAVTMDAKQTENYKNRGIEKDPLVIAPRPDFHLKGVGFPFRQNGSYWSGRPLVFTTPGKQDLKEEQYTFLQQAVWSGGMLQRDSKLCFIAHYNVIICKGNLYLSFDFSHALVFKLVEECLTIQDTSFKFIIICRFLIMLEKQIISLV